MYVKTIDGLWQDQGFMPVTMGVADTVKFVNADVERWAKEMVRRLHAAGADAVRRTVTAAHILIATGQRRDIGDLDRSDGGVCPQSREEVFGPVVAVMPFDDVEEAVKLVTEFLPADVYEPAHVLAHRLGVRRAERS